MTTLKYIGQPILFLDVDKNERLILTIEEAKAQADIVLQTMKGVDVEIVNAESKAKEAADAIAKAAEGVH